MLFRDKERKRKHSDILSLPGPFRLLYKPEMLVMLAVLSAVSSVGRALFAAIPSVQPSSFIIIVTGMTLGALPGLTVGIMTALVSGLWLGIGPWTPWQMLAWGMMGLNAGFFRKRLAETKYLRVIFGAAWGFFFGWIMNLWMIISMDMFNGGYFLGVYAASVPFDAMHAAANAILLWLGGDRLVKTVRHAAVKYGLIS